MRITRSFKIAVGVAILFMCTLCLVYAKPGLWERSEFRAERKHVAQYLKEKYGQDFIIKKVEYYTAYLGDQRQIRTYVVSKDDHPIKFIVTRYVGESEATYRETELFFRQENYRSYLDLKWIGETEAEFKDVAEKVFLRPLLIYTDLSITGSYAYQKFGMVPSYFETLKTNPDVFSDIHTRQVIHLVFFYDVDDTNITAETKKIYLLMKELENMGVKNYRIGIDYYPPAFKEEAQKVIDRIGLEAFVIVEGGWMTLKEYAGSGRQRQYYVFLTEKDIKDAKNPKDILGYFKRQ